jgi:hypothetical protein
MEERLKMPPKKELLKLLLAVAVGLAVLALVVYLHALPAAVAAFLIRFLFDVKRWNDKRRKKQNA